MIKKLSYYLTRHLLPRKHIIIRNFPIPLIDSLISMIKKSKKDSISPRDKHLNLKQIPSPNTDNL